MTLPKLKEVATQLGIDGAAKLKKDALVTAIADLQAANREAAKAEREAIRLAPEDADYHVHFALIRLRQGLIPGAIRAADTALRLDPRNTSAANIKASALLASGRAGQAKMKTKNT